MLDVDEHNRKISLGMKQIEPNPWSVIEEKYPVGTQVRGTVRNITNFGIFVGLEEGIDGLVHVSDISWTEQIKHPSEKFKKGDEVEARRAEDRPREREVLARHQAADGRTPGTTSRGSTRSAPRSPARSRASPTSARS